MKPLFCIDVTESKHSESYNGECFIAAKPCEENLAALEKMRNNLDETVQKSKLPLWLTILKYVTGAAAGIIIGSTISAGAEIGFSTAYHNAPWLTWLGGVSLVVFAALFLLGRRLEKTVSEDDATQQLLHSADTLAECINEELEVPADAATADILFFRYKVKDGEIHPKTDLPYINTEFRIFLRNNCLCLADSETRYDLPMQAFSAIRTVKKRITLLQWNKEEPIKSPQYKPYKLAEANLGWILCRYYHILEFKHEDELYGLYFPCYELPLLERLTGLHAEPSCESAADEQEA